MNASVELERAGEIGKDVTLSDDRIAEGRRKLLPEQGLVKPAPPPNYGPPAPSNWNFSVQMVLVLLAVILFVIFSLLLY